MSLMPDAAAGPWPGYQVTPLLVLPAAKIIVVSAASVRVAAGRRRRRAGTGLQVMTAMSGQDVTALCGPEGKHNADRAGCPELHVVRCPWSGDRAVAGAAKLATGRQHVAGQPTSR